MSDVREGPDDTPNDGAPGTAALATPTKGNIGDFQRFQEWWREAQAHWRDHHIEAEQNYDTVAGRMWDEGDLKVLADQGRPAIVFNRVQPFLQAIGGLEITNRQETRIIPRQVDNAGVAELLTAAIKWVFDDCDGEDEMSAAFRDMLICGVGWVQTRLDYDRDPDGVIVVERVDPMEMFPDPAARKDNLSDARFVFRVKDVPLELARELAPGVPDEDLTASWAIDTAAEADDPHNARLAPFYLRSQSSQIDKERQTVRLVECEYFTYESVFRVQDPRTGQRMVLSEQDHQTLQQRAAMVGMPIQSVKDRRKKYWRVLLGNKILNKSPGAEEGGFTYKAMTGYRDRNKAIWYGVVRAMRDPAQWSNKFLSQILYILNSNAKGGLIMEEDAAENPQDIEDTWADPQAITWVSPGAIQKGKLQPKPPPSMPPELQSLLEFAVNALPQTSGVSPEMLGQVDREQAGVLEMHRTMRGVNVLSQFFDSKRRLQKEQGRLLLWMIRTFISDGRLIRIGGAEDAQYVPLIHQPGVGEYDVVVDDTPWAPNQKERTWGMLMQLLPVIGRMGLPPQAMLEMMKYSPLPEQLVNKVAGMVQQQMQQSQQQNPAMMVEGAKAQDLQAAAELKKAQAQHTLALAARTAGEASNMVSERDARIENLRAAAVANLAKVGIAQQGAALDAATAAADTLLRAHDQVHQQAMDVHQAMQPQMPPGGAQPAPQQPPMPPQMPPQGGPATPG